MGKRLTRSRLLVSPEELALLDRAAVSLGVSHHKFMMDAATERADAALASLGSPRSGNRDDQEKQEPFHDSVVRESAC